jgi:hypothetical protein
MSPWCQAFAFRSLSDSFQQVSALERLTVLPEVPRLLGTKPHLRAEAARLQSLRGSSGCIAARSYCARFTQVNESAWVMSGLEAALESRNVRRHGQDGTSPITCSPCSADLGCGNAHARPVLGGWSAAHRLGCRGRQVPRWHARRGARAIRRRMDRSNSSRRGWHSCFARITQVNDSARVMSAWEAAIESRRCDTWGRTRTSTDVLSPVMNIPVVPHPRSDGHSSMLQSTTATFQVETCSVAVKSCNVAVETCSVAVESCSVAVDLLQRSGRPAATLQSNPAAL